MLVSIEKDIKLYDRIWAALIFFTRLPFWRIHQPPKEAYETVVEFWPLVGWITAPIMAVILFFGPRLMPYDLAIIVAMLSRIAITGALHEDGLTDFIDGFGGGGNDRNRILYIMKDSKIGTYGMLGITIYLFTFYKCLSLCSPMNAAIMVIAADPFCKMLTSQIIQMMPYARTAETAKNGVVYKKFNIRGGIFLMLQGGIPILIIWYFFGLSYICITVPGIVLYFLYLFVWKRIHGYTGDCCGAIFLMTELSFYITFIITHYNYFTN